MWLINSENHGLKEFTDPPGYAILSHKWRDGEVSHQAMLEAEKSGFPGLAEYESTLTSTKPTASRGWTKIYRACRQARDDGISWIWIDTCCINKQSSAELSEAINSMFRWYQQAQVCYAYIDQDPWLESSWFERGWTLQELLAPSLLRFYDCRWNAVGTRSERSDDIAGRTGIDSDLLRADPSSRLHNYSVAQRMAWASGRKTTRIEDRAYSLMGIFSVNMPLLYGEGEKAFLRLQEKIIETSDDQSIFAWDRSTTSEAQEVGTLLAPYPECFENAANIIALRDPTSPRSSFEVNNLGLRITLPYVSHRKSVLLTCGVKGSPLLISLRVKPHKSISSAFVFSPMAYELLPISSMSESRSTNMTIVSHHGQRQDTTVDLNTHKLCAWVVQAQLDPWTYANISYPFETVQRYPKEFWNERMGVFEMPTWWQSAGILLTYTPKTPQKSRKLRKTYQVNVCFAIDHPLMSTKWSGLKDSLPRRSAMSLSYGEDMGLSAACEALAQKLARRSPNDAYDQSAGLSLKGFDQPGPTLVGQLTCKLVSEIPVLELSLKVRPPSGQRDLQTASSSR